MDFDCVGFTGTLNSSSTHPYLWNLAVLFGILVYRDMIGKPLDNAPGPLFASTTRFVAGIPFMARRPTPSNE